VLSTACPLACRVVSTTVEYSAGLDSFVERRSGVSLWGVGAILLSIGISSYSGV
jgi:hypothetical protein